MYCSITDLLKDLPRLELINLANDENRAESVINLASTSDVLVIRVNSIIADSDEQINVYLRGKYTLPLTNIPARVVKYSKIITIYNLYLRRFPVDTPYKAEYDKIITELMNVQKGMVFLDFPSTDSNADVESNNYVSSITSADRIFNDTLLNTYI